LRSGSWLSWGASPLLSITLAVIVAVTTFACVPRVGIPPRPLPPLSTWTPHAERRGIDLSPKTLGAAEYEALDVLRPGSVVLFSSHLGDADPLHWMSADAHLQKWLQTHQDVLQVVRMWPVRGPDDPRRMAQRIVRLHHRFPWIRWFQVANEPDIEWPDASWDTIAEWTTDVWWHVERYRRGRNADIRLLFPPLAQGSPLDPEHVGYDALRPAIELYLDHGDGIAGHEYWDRGSLYLVEDAWPTWLRERLSSVPFFVTECGRRPIPENGLPDYTLGEEMVAFAARTRARVVAPFVLSSPGGTFDQHDFVDREGALRPHLFAWGTFGP
jgi:hypothetical protein